MQYYSARSLRLWVLIACLAAAVATSAAQAPTKLKVFRGTLVNYRVRTEMEVLEDYLIGIDENNLGTVSCRGDHGTQRKPLRAYSMRQSQLCSIARGKLFIINKTQKSFLTENKHM